MKYIAAPTTTETMVEPDRRPAPLENERRFRTFVLGAGFSRGAGLPLASELWNEVMRRADSTLGRDNVIRRDLRAYLQFKSAIGGGQIEARDVDFEDFLGYLDIEHFLSLKGSDTWSSAGNKSQLLIRWFIGQTLFERQRDHRARRAAAYGAFAAGLRPSDVVLTFNYDTLVEELLDEIEQPYRLFPSRLESVGITSSTVDTSRDDQEVIVIKLHGSLDWFDRSGYDESVAQNERFASNAPSPDIADGYRRFPPRHPVFGRDSLVTAEPLLEGPQPEEEALRTIWRVKDPSPLYADSAHGRVLLGGSPFMLSPSYQKILYSEKLRSFWSGMGRTGGGLGLSIIGFSLPPHDQYAVQALYSLTRNYTDSWYDENYFGWLKLPLRLVDLQRDADAERAYRERYRFVNWERTETHFSGFDDGAVEFLFRETRGGYQPREVSLLKSDGQSS